MNKENWISWFNRLLLTLVAFFLLQINNKFNDVVETLEKLVIKIEVSAKEFKHLEGKVEENKKSIEDLEIRDRQFEDLIRDWYKNNEPK